MPVILDRVSAALELRPMRLERLPMNLGSAEAVRAAVRAHARIAAPREHAETPLAGDVPR